MEEKKLNKPWLDLQRVVKEGLKCAKVHLCLYRSELKFPGTVLPELRSEPIFCKELLGGLLFSTLVAPWEALRKLDIDCTPLCEKFAQNYTEETMVYLDHDIHMKSPHDGTHEAMVYGLGHLRNAVSHYSYKVEGDTLVYWDATNIPKFPMFKATVNVDHLFEFLNVFLSTLYIWSGLSTEFPPCGLTQALTKAESWHTPF